MKTYKEILENFDSQSLELIDHILNKLLPELFPDEGNTQMLEKLKPIIEGYIAEKEIREKVVTYLTYIFFQSDIQFQYNGKYWYQMEIKYQEKFEKDNYNYPFDGHGLPPAQIEKKLSLQKEKEMRALLIIKDKEDKVFFWNWLDILDSKQFMFTKTKARKIYPLKNYNKALTTNDLKEQLRNTLEDDTDRKSNKNIKQGLQTNHKIHKLIRGIKRWEKII